MTPSINRRSLGQTNYLFLSVDVLFQQLCHSPPINADHCGLQDVIELPIKYHSPITYGFWSHGRYYYAQQTERNIYGKFEGTVSGDFLPTYFVYKTAILVQINGFSFCWHFFRDTSCTRNQNWLTNVGIGSTHVVMKHKSFQTDSI